MTVEEAYQFMQAAWVELYNVEVGDIVKVLRVAKTCELGCCYYTNSRKNKHVGNFYKILDINSDCLMLDVRDVSIYCYPFFCLEFVKKAEPKIEITVKVNGETRNLKNISEETLLNIRRDS